MSRVSIIAIYSYLVRAELVGVEFVRVELVRVELVKLDLVRIELVSFIEPFILLFEQGKLTN